jgi:Cys-rich repeat protein
MSQNIGRVVVSVLTACAAWLPVAGLFLALSSCTQQTSPPARAASAQLPQSARSPLSGNGPTTSGTATFDAVTVDPTTWQGSPAGTGTFQIPLTPALSGGPSSVAAAQPNGSTSMYYVMVGDFTAQSGTALALVSDQPFAAGTTNIDGVHVFAAAFDIASGNELASAQSGTVTLTAAGTQVGQHVTGSLSGSFQAATPQCTTSSDCPAGEVCQNGACVAVQTGCTSNSQCPAGQTCVSGVCQASQGGGCTQQSGSGSFTVTEAAVSTCGALGTPAANVASAAVGLGQINPTSTAPAILLFDPSSAQQTGLAIQLSACPAQTGALTIGSGVDAYFYSAPVSASANVQLAAIFQASGGTVTFTSVGTTLAGTANVTFDNGGTGTASFSLQ